MIDLHLSAFAPRWRFLYVVRIDAYLGLLHHGKGPADKHLPVLCCFPVTYSFPHVHISRHRIVTILLKAISREGIF